MDLAYEITIFLHTKIWTGIFAVSHWNSHSFASTKLSLFLWTNACRSVCKNEFSQCTYALPEVSFTGKATAKVFEKYLEIRIFFEYRHSILNRIGWRAILLKIFEYSHRPSFYPYTSILKWSYPGKLKLHQSHNWRSQSLVASHIHGKNVDVNNFSAAKYASLHNAMPHCTYKSGEKKGCNNTYIL